MNFIGLCFKENDKQTNQWHKPVKILHYATLQRLPSNFKFKEFTMQEGF
jgi:hypothetical protein